MDSSFSRTMLSEDESRALGALIDAFHPFISLQKIASAYCKAGNDIDKASEILCELQDSDSNVVHHGNVNDSSIAKQEEALVEVIGCDNKGSLKPKKQSAAVGSVSSFLGNAYTRSTSSNKKEMIEATKPLKLEMPKHVEELESESVCKEEDVVIEDIEEFLFAMLGDGFQLSKAIIADVLGQCGYDMKKTMDKLLALSVKSLDKGKKNDSNREKHSGNLPDSESSNSKEIHKKSSSTESLNKERSDLPREVLLALFSAPDTSEEEPKKKRLEWGLNRTRVVGQTVVTGPPDDISFRTPLDLVNIQPEFEYVENETDPYQMLRRDAKEHWDKMKECYKQAVEAFSIGERSKAKQFIEEGKCHTRMAREADERSAKQILEAKNPDTRDDVPLDLHIHSARDSVRLLKKHLVSLAKIPMFRYLKVTANTNADDTTKGKRRRMIIKLLERESVRWIEEDGNPEVLLIPLDEIDKSKFTFLKDHEEN